MEWDPWRPWQPRLPEKYSSCLELTSKRVIFEGPTGRCWYLGERVLRQVHGNMNAAVTPSMPPENMRHANHLVGNELEEALRGWDAEGFTSPRIEYTAFC